MTKSLLVIDDDLELVADLRSYLAKEAPSVPVIGPPDLMFDVRYISSQCPLARAVVLDLHIAASATYGEALLRKLARQLDECDIPVIIWTKYFVQTILFEPGGLVHMTHHNRDSPSFSHIGEDQLKEFNAYDHIYRLRSTYRGARSFVTKLTPDPVSALVAVLTRSGVIPPEFMKSADQSEASR